MISPSLVDGGDGCVVRSTVPDRLFVFGFEEDFTSGALGLWRAGLVLTDDTFGGVSASAPTGDFLVLDDFDMACLEMCNGNPAVTETDPGRPTGAAG